MSPEDLNLLRNPNLTPTRDRPKSWTWISPTPDVTWSYAVQDDQPLLCIESDTDADGGFFSQRLRCKANHWYRIEARVTARCKSQDPTAGAVLCVTSTAKDGTIGPRERLAGVLRSDGAAGIRGYYKTPGDARSLLIQIGIHAAKGDAVIHSVYAVPNIDPDLVSHPLALPPPPYAEPPHRKVRTVTLVEGDDDATTALLDLLRARFGPRRVRTAPAKTPLRDLDTDAVILTCRSRPPDIRTRTALERAAANRIIIITPDAFARVVGDGLSTRTIEQADDPIHARIHWACHLTRGFALRDMFPFAGQTEDPRVFRQTQFRKSPALTRLLKDGYHPILMAMTDSESTSNQPICLYKPTDRGGLIVFDTDPLTAEPTSRDEPNLAAFLLLNLLGCEQSALGQYTVPAETEKDFFDMLAEIVTRFPPMQLNNATREEAVIEVGVATETFGLPQRHRPLILLRTGLTGSDVAGVYATLNYLKQLVRPAPYQSPYTHALLERFRLAWIPLSAPWREHHRIDQPDTPTPLHIETEPGSLACLIEITDGATNRFRILTGGALDTLGIDPRTLNDLWNTFSTKRYVHRIGPSLSANSSDLHGRSWRTDDGRLEIVEHATRLNAPPYDQLAADGAGVLRIEIPGPPDALICDSIRRTDLAATALELIIGLQFGLIAVNRLATPLSYDAHPPLNPGQSIVQPRPNPNNHASTSRAG